MLLAALYRLVLTESVRGPADVAAAVVAFALLQLWQVAPWPVVAVSAAAGEWVLGG